MNRYQMLILAIGIFACSWAGPLIRMADEASFLYIATSRLVIAAPIMIVVSLIGSKNSYKSLKIGVTCLMVLSGIALAAHFAFWVSSISRTSILASVALVAMSPLFAALGGWLFLGERPNTRVLGGIFLSFCGATALLISDFEDIGNLSGDIYAFIGAILASIYLLVGRYARQRVDMPVYAAIVYSVAAIVLVITFLSMENVTFSYEANTYIFILLLALVPQLIGHNAINYSLGFAPAAVVALAILGEPVGSSLIAALLLDEIPSFFEIGVGVVILLGVYIGVRGGAISAD
ncbi:MAG: DMT family transporter [Dehalococcoidia bacterium]|nr:DMT family transporter [Dehalococcoidia bacterium]